MKRSHHMPFGVEPGADGGARFRLWAPSARQVMLKAQGANDGALQADLNDVGDGWFELDVAGLHAGARYSYRIDDEIDVPDPASRWNPQGVRGPSSIVDPEAFAWSDAAWRGRSWNEAVVYEMHIGCFTERGTFAAAIERLDDLADLGVTALELMPLGAFAGERGWGYDGVLPFAPHAAYGEPQDLKRLIEAAHAREMMVLLDVVYNHFGPEGNFLARYAREFFTDRHRTPWGDAINFAHPVVRQFFIHNALYWLDEYRFDGLRIDAVHAMHDQEPRFIDELAATVQEGPGRERSVHIVLENHRNEARLLGSRGRSGTGEVSQWNDDFHHPLHAILTGEEDGYYIDYADRPLEHLGRVLTQGFAYQGETSVFSGQRRGEPSTQLPPTAFVNFLQNHDQIGNRAFGERLDRLVEPDPLRAAYAILLLAPQVPLLFMGEEYAASQPFLYFCDYKDELAEAVRTGRRAEFARFRAFAAPESRADIPDPNAAATFERSRLNWSERASGSHARRLSDICTLLRVRAEYVRSCIPKVIAGESSYEVRDRGLRVQWALAGDAALVLLANLCASSQRVEPEPGEIIYSTTSAPQDGELCAWEVRLLLAEV
jgi:maltooligosyltrehalose trehalohydrolase